MKNELIKLVKKAIAIKGQSGLCDSSAGITGGRVRLTLIHKDALQDLLAVVLGLSASHDPQLPENRGFRLAFTLLQGASFGKNWSFSCDGDEFSLMLNGSVPSVGVTCSFTLSHGFTDEDLAEDPDLFSGQP